MMTAFLLVLILFLGFLSTFFSRGNLVLLMLLPASQFLGFIDPMQIAIKGLFDIHAFIIIIIFMSVLVSIHRYKILFFAKFRVNLLILIILWGYGVFYPFFMGYSSLFYSLKSSKEFLTVFSYVAVLLFVNNRNEIDLGWKYIIYLGIYYSIIEIIGQITGPSLQEIISYIMRREESVFTKIYVPFWPVILLSLLHNYYAILLKVSKPYFFTLVSFLGMMLTFFRSYLVATFAAIPIFILISGQGVAKIAQRMTGLVAIFSVSVICLTLVIGSELDSVEKFYDKFFVSAITEVATHSGGALIGRERVTESKDKVLMKSPLFGYGFIDKDSHLSSKLKHTIQGGGLGFVDKGTLDIPIKFGYIGFSLLIVSVGYVILILSLMIRKYNDQLFKVRCLSVVTILLISIFVLPVHAPLTYSFFLLPFGIALGLIEKECSLLDVELKTLC